MGRQLFVAAVTACDGVVLDVRHMTKPVAKRTLFDGVSKAAADAPVDTFHIFLRMGLGGDTRKQDSAAAVADRFLQPRGQRNDIRMNEIVAGGFLRFHMAGARQRRVERGDLCWGQPICQPFFAADPLAGPGGGSLDFLPIRSHCRSSRF